MRETTTSTRRVVMAKVKTRPNQRHQNFTPSRPYNPEQKVVPVLFDRLSSQRAPLAIPAPSWNDWKVIEDCLRSIDIKYNAVEVFIHILSLD